MRSISGLLPFRQRVSLWLFASARVIANALDLIGLAGIALLATAFGSIAAGTNNSTPIELPWVGPIVITEVEAVILACGICFAFLFKSFFSIWLNLKIALAVASMEGDFAEALTRNFFSSDPTFEGGLSETVARFQTSILVSTSAISGFLNARIAAIAELSLSLSLLAAFMLVNPVATLATSAYLGLVLFVLMPTTINPGNIQPSTAPFI